MGFAACAAAANSRAAASSDGCGDYIDRWEYLTNNPQFQALPTDEQEKFYHRQLKAADKLTPHAAKFCEEVADIIDDVDAALRPDRD